MDIRGSIVDCLLKNLVNQPDHRCILGHLLKIMRLRVGSYPDIG